MTKKIILLFLLVGVSSLAWAQRHFLPAVERAVLKTPPVQVSSLSRQINAAAYRQVAGVFLPPLPISLTLKPVTPIPTQQQRQVFQVQQGPVAHSTGSAFALEIDGKIWGVTAGHVMRNIRQNPYMVVKNEYGKQISIAISRFYFSNPNASDVALFEIPPDLFPYIDILSPAQELPAVQTVTQSPCFIHGNLSFLPAEEILFAGPHRILLRDQAHRNMSGYCGSPVLAKGKVIGLHVGFYTQQDLQHIHWNSLLHHVSAQQPPAMHIAVPIEQVALLARNITAQTLQPLQVLGHTVAWLTPHNQLYSIELLRGGFVKQVLNLHPFIHFDKLEEFFDLQEGDVLRITILSPKTISQAQAITILDVDIPSGRVTKNL